MLEHADLTGDKAIQDAALLAEHKKLSAELKALKRSLSWRVDQAVKDDPLTARGEDLRGRCIR